MRNITNLKLYITQTCSGKPISTEELKQREQELLEKKRRKQEERRQRLEEKKRSSGSAGVRSSISGSSVCSSPTASIKGDANISNSSHVEPEIDVVGEGPSNSDNEHRHEQVSDEEEIPLKSAFSIDSLLEAPKVPRGRRPNSKYPRVQASKSMNPLSFGMYPLYPITQPVGFQVERPPTPQSPTCCAELTSTPILRFSSPSSLKASSQGSVLYSDPPQDKPTDLSLSVQKTSANNVGKNDNGKTASRDEHSCNVSIPWSRQCFTPPETRSLFWKERITLKRPHSNPGPSYTATYQSNFSQLHKKGYPCKAMQLPNVLHQNLDKPK